MNTNYRFKRNELIALSTVAVMAPTLRLFPAGSAQLAGKAAWLSPFLALPVLILYVCFIGVFMGRRQEGEGLVQLIRRCLGERLAPWLLWPVLLWLLLYSAFVLRSGADRIITTIYPNSSPPIFCISMGLLGFAAAAGAARSLVRVGKIVLPVVMGALLLVRLFSLFSIDTANLLPISSYDVLPALRGSLAVVDVLSVSLYCICFIEGQSEKENGRTLPFSLWMLAMVALLTLLSVDVLGCFGSELCSILTRPFFSLVKNIVFFNSLERVEALVVSLWIFPDFLLLSVFLFGAQQSLRLLLGKEFHYRGEGLLDMKNGRWCIALCALLAIVVSILMAPNSKMLNLWSSIIIPLANLVFAFILLPLIYIVGKIGKRI